MDFMKREDQNVIDEENYKLYLENLQKSHQIEDYQHTQISMEQLHQAMQSSINGSIQNFNLPLSPRQMSTLMLRTNHITRNDLPTHLRNIDLDLHLNELQNRHEDFMSQNLNRNIDLSMLRSNELDLQAGLAQTLQNMTEELQNQNINHDLNQEIDLSHHLRQNVPEILRQNVPEILRQNVPEILRQNVPEILRQNVPEIIEERRTPMVIQGVPDHLLDQIRIDPSQRLDQISRIDQRLDQGRIDPQNRTDQIGRTDLRLNQISRFDQQLANERHLISMPVQFSIKAEQEDDYFYDNINQGINNVEEINGHLQGDHSQTQTALQTETQVYSIYPPHTNIPSLNPLDMYSRTQFPQNFRENPQNLVVPRPYDNTNPYQELKKTKQEGVDPAKKPEQPKENLKPIENKIFYNEFVNNKNDENQLKTDELSINIKGEYICYKCNEIFPSKRGLKQHAKTCTDSDETEKIGKFCCSQCAYRCQSPAILKIHERTHSGEKPFSCNFCDYKSGQKNNVAKHILVHMKEKPFRCQYCDYRCAQKNNLVVHERTHTGYKPFACNFCDYRTVQKPNLVKHMYLHTDQKPFSCDVCNYRCVQKTNLTKHKQRHLNEKDVKVKDQIKPYRPRQRSVKCPSCPYRCVQKSSMEKHMQFKHGAEFSSENFENESIQNLSVKKDDYNELLDKESLIQS